MFSLRRQFRTCARTASPDRAFRARLRAELAEAFEQTYPASDRGLHWKLATVPVVVVVVVFLAGTGV